MKMVTATGCRLAAAFLLLLIAATPLRAQQTPTDNSAEIAALTIELAAAGEALAVAQARYDTLPWSRDRTDDFVVLAGQVDTLRERLAGLGRRITALRNAAPVALTAAGLAPLRASLNEYGGAPLPASVGEGAVLAFETDLQFPTSDIPQIATLSWQVLDTAGNAVPGLAKREQVAETGGSKNYRFRFRIADLANGAYSVRFTYQPAQAGAEAKYAEAGFTMMQAVRIQRLVVAPDAVAAQHNAVLFPEQAPHLFVYFSATATDVVTVDFALLAGNGRAERYRQRVERPLKQGEAEQRVGIRLDPGLVRAGEHVFFSATVTGPDGASASREIGFRVENHVARIQLANRLRANEVAFFRIEAPATFVAPLRIELGPNSATASLSGETSGRLVPVLPADSTSDGYGSLAVTITDAEGRVAQGRAAFTIQAPPPPPPPAVAQAPSGDWARANDTSKPSYVPPPAAPAPPDTTMADALRDFQKQMAQIQADKQAAERKSELERQQMMQRFQQQPQMRGLLDPPQASTPRTSAPQASTQQAQSHPVQTAYWTITTHTVIPGVCRSNQTANTCQIVQSKTRPPTQCGDRQRCMLSRFYGDGAPQCNQYGAWKGFMDVIGPHSREKAEEYCQRVKSSPYGLVRIGGSCTFFCGVEKLN